MCIRFLLDVRAVGQCMLIGFNSSSTTKDDEDGFDLPWIINRSTWNVKLNKEFGTKLFQKIGHQIKSIDILPDCYIIDAQVIFHNHEYFKLNSKDKAGYRLDDFLGQVKVNGVNIPQKFEHSIEEMNRLFKIRGSDCTDISAYCLYDCFSLFLALEYQLQYFDQVKSNVKFFNCPLSWVLYKNPSQWITFRLLREGYAKGFMF